jgi:hypothetical protein
MELCKAIFTLSPLSNRKNEVKTLLDDMAKQNTNNKDATFETFNDYSKNDLSNLLDNIINNISKLSNERDFFFDYFKNIETQMELKQEKDFAKGAVYKKSKIFLTI